MSQLITLSTALTANQLTTNVLAGDLNEFLSRPARISVFMSASGSSPQAIMTAGGVTQLQGAIIPNTNRSPVRPDDGMVQFMAPAGARLFLQYRETAGGTPTVRLLIDIDYLA